MRRSKRTTAPARSKPKRTFYTTNGAKLANSLSLHDDLGPDIEPCSEAKATLVGSATGNYTASGPMHMPAIDIDFPCQLVESSTPGHYHLYIDKEIPLKRYLEILGALSDAGIVQRGFFRSALVRGQTFLRKPGVTKEDI